MSAFNPKARKWVEGRESIFDRLKEAVGQTSQPVAWVHAASLGEFEQGRPVIEAIRRRHPEYKILLTFFSPSGYEIRKNYEGADWVFYLPADTPRNAKRFLETVRPRIAIFVKYEFWLNYLSELRKTGVKTFIVSAIFRRDSIFFRKYGKAFRRALAAFEHIYVQDRDSETLMKSIGFGQNVTVAGDTRFDRVADLARAAKELPEIADFAQGREVFAAGSTWAPDEKILQRLINENPEVKFVVAPHEMDEERIEALIRNTRGGVVRYTAMMSAPVGAAVDAQVLIVDTLGILSSVYRYARYAYIGGGFGAGIHNTLEAVTYGLPVAFGPNFYKFREARELIGLQAAACVENGDQLSEWFGGLRSDKEAYDAISRKALDYIESNTGATDRVIEGIFGQA